MDTRYGARDGTFLSTDQTVPRTVAFDSCNIDSVGGGHGREWILLSRDATVSQTVAPKLVARYARRVWSHSCNIGSVCGGKPPCQSPCCGANPCSLHPPPAAVASVAFQILSKRKFHGTSFGCTVEFLARVEITDLTKPQINLCVIGTCAHFSSMDQYEKSHI